MGNPLTLASTVVGLKGHYKSQGLSVPVRSVSPFSDPSSNLAQPSRSSAIRLATGQHGPDDPSVLVGDRDRRAVIAAPLAKLVDPHTSRVGFSHCRADNCARTMYEKCPQVLIATLCDTRHHFAIATRMLAWYQAQPGCQVAAVLEVGAVADRRYHCGRRLRPDSPDLGNPLANLAGLEDRSDLAIKSFDPFVDLQHECIQA